MKKEEEDKVECEEEDEEIEETDDYCHRPLDLEPLSAAQFKLFYRLAKPGEEDREPHTGREVPVVTPADTPPLPHQKLVLQQKLPVLRPDGSTVVYKLVKKPRILTWSPQSTYSDLYMFKVRELLTKNAALIWALSKTGPTPPPSPEFWIFWDLLGHFS